MFQNISHPLLQKTTNIRHAFRPLKKYITPLTSDVTACFFIANTPTKSKLYD
jgi:hypothetical protein